jgi:hypothetical protein
MAIAKGPKLVSTTGLFPPSRKIETNLRSHPVTSLYEPSHVQKASFEEYGLETGLTISAGLARSGVCWKQPLRKALPEICFFHRGEHCLAI